MHIILDKDSVLYDIHSPWFSRHNTEYPHHILRYEDVTQWNTIPFAAPECGGKIYNYLHDPEVYSEGEPTPYAVSVTFLWAQRGWELSIATKLASPEVFTAGVYWCQVHFPHIRRIIGGVGGDYKHMLLGDVLIDDYPKNLEGFTGLPILFDQPYNQEETRFVRVGNWRKKNWWEQADAVIQEFAALQERVGLYDALFFMKRERGIYA
jgi:5'(3')-deoxyribonucleotidase